MPCFKSVLQAEVSALISAWILYNTGRFFHSGLPVLIDALIIELVIDSWNICSYRAFREPLWKIFGDFHSTTCFDLYQYICLSSAGRYTQKWATYTL